MLGKVVRVVVRWRPFAVLATASVSAVISAATVGVVPAFAAAQTASGACTDDGYRAEVSVKYRRVESGLYIGSVRLAIDDRAGPRNRVRIAVRQDDKAAFNYDSGRRITAGPYIFDYQDHPIKVPLSGDGEIRVEVTVDFDAEGSKAHCTATVRI